MGYLEARGLLTYEKNLKSKFSCQTPFKEKNFNCDTVTGTSTNCINFVERSVGKKYYLTLTKRKSDKILSTESFHTEYF